MSNGLTLSKTQYETISGRLTRLEGMVKFLVGKLEDVLETEPACGSDEWWKWGIKKGKEAIEKGEYTEISSKKQLDNFFKSL